MGLEKCNDCLYKFKLNTDEPCSYCKEIDLGCDIKSSEYIKFNSKCSTCLYKDNDKKVLPCDECTVIKPDGANCEYEESNNKKDEVIEKGLTETKLCGNCINRHKPINEKPCDDCYRFTDKPSFKFDIGIIKQDKTVKAPSHKNYDEHYQTEYQPIEVMQANMTQDEFIGYLKGNITKYILRIGRKDDVKKEAAKIRRYAQWLEQVVNGETINPRK